jgi:predicted transcriptional regulator of viral defense system
MAFDIETLDPDRIYDLDELARRGLARWDVARLVQRELLSSLGTGVYVRHDFVPDAYDDLAVIAIRCPSATFNLYTATDLHGMNNRNLPKVYIGVPVTQKPPKIGGNFMADLNVIRWKRPQDIGIGIEERIIRGVAVRLTDPERTVCDMWRYSFNNPGLRGKPTKIGDEALKYCLNAYLDQNDGASSALVDMMERLEVTRNTYDAFLQDLRNHIGGYSHERTF